MKGTRFIAISALLLILGAAFAGGSSLLTWASATWTNDLQGEFETSATGGDAAQALIPLAVAALAALGAVLASRGWLRRAVGVLVSLAGATVVWQGITGLVSAPTDALIPQNRTAAEVGSARLEVWGPILATLGGIALVVAGVLVVLAPATKRVMGSRYERGGPAVLPQPDDTARDVDLDAVTMWKAMDANLDPTDLDPTDQDPTGLEPTEIPAADLDRKKQQRPPAAQTQLPPNGSI